MKIFSTKKEHTKKNAFHLRAQRVRSKQREYIGSLEGHSDQNVVQVRPTSAVDGGGSWVQKRGQKER